MLVFRGLTANGKLQLKSRFCILFSPNRTSINVKLQEVSYRNNVEFRNLQRGLEPLCSDFLNNELFT